jgi:CobQ-like glutamine amidotransferase family enzyme
MNNSIKERRNNFMKMIRSTLNAQPYTITIGWLYPDLMSTYGDRGNIIVLTKRCEWRGIKVTILPITQQTTHNQLQTIDVLFGGGSQDREQEIVMRDLRDKKGKLIKALIENDIPALFVCGAPQLMGNYYEPAEGQRIEGLGVFDMISRHPGSNQPRLVGNTIAEVDLSVIARNRQPAETKQSPTNEITPWRSPRSAHDDKFIIVGFENHGGRTYLGPNTKPFAKVIKGYGNNGEDGTEGVVYKNAIGCYFHGPLLPKNPAIADFLIQRALEVKYKMEIKLEPLDDTLENQAKNAMLQRLQV